MKVSRWISIYDRKSEEFLQEFRIDGILSFDQLKKIFRPYKDDPLLYMVYNITPKRYLKLKEVMNLDFDYDVDNFIYQLDCYQD